MTVVLHEPLEFGWFATAKTLGLNTRWCAPNLPIVPGCLNHGFAVVPRPRPSVPETATFALTPSLSKCILEPSETRLFHHS